VRPLAELLSDDPAWPLVQTWIAEATNDVLVLPCARERGEHTLHRLQVTSRSTLGAIALETGGVLVDHGWLRVLGAGGVAMHANLTAWNKVGNPPAIEPLERALVVGYDAIGGFFALDGGEFGGERGHIHYFAPDTLRWGSLERGYADFIQWTLTGDLDTFYASLRWPEWRQELAFASSDEGFSLNPPPFLEEGKPVANVDRALVPMTELWGIQRGFARQLAGHPDPTNISVRVRK
jgi:hypothetical protein